MQLILHQILDSYSPPQLTYVVGPQGPIHDGVGSPYPSGVASSTYPTSSAPYPPTPFGSTRYTTPGSYEMPQPYAVPPPDVSAPSASYSNPPQYGWAIPETNTGFSNPSSLRYGPGVPLYPQNHGYGLSMQQDPYSGYGKSGIFVKWLVFV